MVVDEAEYITFSNGGAKFDPPMNPGAYPTTVDENNSAVREKQVAEHKESKEVYLTQPSPIPCKQRLSTASTKNDSRAKQWVSTTTGPKQGTSIFVTMAETLTTSMSPN
jgi:hypothetical protein